MPPTSARLQPVSIPPYLISTRTACRQSSIHLYLHVGLRVATLSRGSPRGGRANPACRATGANPIKRIKISRLHACSMPPELTSQAPELHTSMPPRLHACSATPELPSSIPPHLHTRSVSPELHSSTPTHPQRCLPSSMPPYLYAYHVCTPAARLHTSIPHLYTYGMLPELRTSTPPRPYTCGLFIKI